MKITPKTEPLPDLPRKFESDKCFGENSRVAIPAGPWDVATVKKIIARLRKSEHDKTQCGAELIEFYKDLATELKED